MRIVKYKNKNANHGLRINGKRIVFKNGEAKVNEADAGAIEEMDNPDYTVVKPVVEVQKVEKKPRKETKKPKEKTDKTVKKRKKKDEE